MAYFPKYSTFLNLQKNPNFLEIWTKLQMSKLEETFNILKAFQYSTLARMFYIVSIKKIFD